MTGRAGDEFLHVEDPGGIEHRASGGEGDHAHRAGQAQGREGRAVERVDRDVAVGPVTTAEPFAVGEHGGVVLLALTDHDGSAKRGGQEHGPHGRDGRLVGGDFVAAAHPGQRGDCGRFGRRAYGGDQLGRPAVGPYHGGFGPGNEWTVLRHGPPLAGTAVSVLSKLLASYADHPNVAGVTILSLGCQNMQVQDFLNDLKKRTPNFDKPLYIFEQQQSKSEEELITEAIRKTLIGLVEVNKIERQPVPLSDLCIGVKCGGSDGFSGISANPAIGYTSDLVVALGGKVLLAEFPELCGAEQGLVDRCVNETIANKFIKLMNDYNAWAHHDGSGFHMNPSPGNIKDGLITDAIKSAGAAKKGGSAPVADVLNYTEQATKPGLSLVCTPGNDVEATTGKAASGATLILFTTGLGTPTGNAVAPTIKIATNSALALRMADIIDIDTGPIITGEKTIEEMGEEILEYCIRAASGEIIPKAVLLNQDDFIPWKRGVSL